MKVGTEKNKDTEPEKQGPNCDMVILLRLFLSSFRAVWHTENVKGIIDFTSIMGRKHRRLKDKWLESQFYQDWILYIYPSSGPLIK